MIARRTRAIIPSLFSLVILSEAKDLLSLASSDASRSGQALSAVRREGSPPIGGTPCL